MPFEHPSPHVIELEVEARDIDAYDHVNNAVYLTWLDRAAWSHSAALGVPLEKCVALRRGMAALRTEIDFVRAALRGDRVRVATWIAVADRLRVERRFQVLRVFEAIAGRFLPGPAARVNPHCHIAANHHLTPWSPRRPPRWRAGSGGPS